MIYLRRLAHLMEHQHLTLVGAKDNMRYVILTDRRLTMLEKHPTKAGCEDETFHYVPSYKKGMDPMSMGLDLDAAGLPILPEGTELVTAEEDCKETNRKLMEAEKAIELIDSTMVSTKPFTLPGSIHAIKDDWLAIRFNGGKLHLRSAKTYAKLADAKEFAFETVAADIEDDICFAIPSDMWRVCKELAGDKVVISVNKNKKNNAVYVGIRTPDFTLLYFCKPITLPEVKDVEAAKPVETPEAPEKVEEVADAETQQQEGESAPEEQGAEEPQEQSAEEPVEQPVEEPTSSQSPGSGCGPTGDGGDDEASGRNDDGDGNGVNDAPAGATASKPRTELDDYDVQEALDTLLPDLVKTVKDVTHASSVEMAKILKNIAKQTRKQMGRKADPSELAELQAKLAEANKRADAAEAVLTGVRGELEPMKAILNIKTKGFWK